MSGPPRKPTALKMLANNPGEKALNTSEPQPVQELFPVAPDWLSADAARIWTALMPDLVPLGLATRIDKGALGRYCTYFAMWVSVKRQLEELPNFTMPVHDVTRRVNQQTGCYVYNNETGEVVKDKTLKKLSTLPQFSQLLKLDATMRRLESEFGLTPAARTRISIEIQAGEGAAAKPRKKFVYRDRGK
jgi:P27 family predicted phage terminase small subunit